MPTEAGDLILGFIRASGASLGSSKSLCRPGKPGEHTVLPFLTHMNQVGQTGSNAAPRERLFNLLSRAKSCTLWNWRFIGERRAISLDANCVMDAGARPMLSTLPTRSR